VITQLQEEIAEAKAMIAERKEEEDEEEEPEAAAG
jgi:hypothetical protein